MYRWRLRPCVFVLVLLACGELCRTAAAQEQKEPWEGKIVREVLPDGFHNQDWNNYRNRLSIRPGITLTAAYIVYFKFINPEANNAESWWFGISPEGIGTLGMLVNFAVALIVSRFTPAPPPRITRLVDLIRVPRGAG